MTPRPCGPVGAVGGQVAGNRFVRRMASTANTAERTPPRPHATTHDNMKAYRRHFFSLPLNINRYSTVLVPKLMDSMFGSSLFVELYPPAPNLPTESEPASNRSFAHSSNPHTEHRGGMAVMWTGLVVVSVVITTSAAVHVATHSHSKQVPRKQLVNRGSRMDATASTSTDSKKSTSGVDEGVARRAALVREWTEVANTRCHNDIGQTHNITSMTGTATRHAIQVRSTH
jgi:hypothetical protein